MKQNPKNSYTVRTMGGGFTKEMFQALDVDKVRATNTRTLTHTRGHARRYVLALMLIVERHVNDCCFMLWLLLLVEWLCRQERTHPMDIH